MITTRRGFFTACLTGLAAAALGEAGVGGVRTIWKKTPDGWRVVRMFELKAGDVFRMTEIPGDHTAESDPEFVGGVWQIMSSTSPPDHVVG